MWLFHRCMTDQKSYQINTIPKPLKLAGDGFFAKDGLSQSDTKARIAYNSPFKVVNIIPVIFSDASILQFRRADLNRKFHKSYKPIHHSLLIDSDK